jgi:lipopolysaccharide export LptBFGC system permease protein LptF
MKKRRARDAAGSASRDGGMRIVLFQLMDTYVLSNFIFYFILLLAAWITITQLFNFFDLLGDIVKNQIPMSRVAVYHLFLTPLLVYQTLPVSVLLAVLVTFGVMTGNNEVTAFKACGISVRRLGMPVLLMSGVLSLALFGADYSWIPRANRIQDEIRNEIKGRPAQTYLHPQSKWIIDNYRIFYTIGFDASEKMMIEPYVFELNPKTFELEREISANRARWQPNIKQWVWEQGTARDLCGVIECKLNHFTVTSFPEITETPDDFLIPVQQSQQMNYVELAQYIRKRPGLRYRQASGAVLREVRSPHVRAYHGADLGAFRIPRGQSRRHGRYRRQHCSRYGISRSRETVRTDGQRELSAARSRRLVPGRALLARGTLPHIKDAQLRNERLRSRYNEAQRFLPQQCWISRKSSKKRSPRSNTNCATSCRRRSLRRVCMEI